MDSETYFLGGCTLVSSLIVYFTGRSLSNQQDNIHKKESTPIYRPSELLDALNDSHFISKFQKSEHNPNEYLIPAFIEGEVSC